MSTAVKLTLWCRVDGGNDEERPALRADAGPRSAMRLTAVFSVPTGPADVLRELGDVEALPHWAAGFCERVEIVCGHWVAWTALGELFVTLETDAATSEVVMRVGWCPRRSITLRWRIQPQADGGARVEWMADDLAEPEDVRLARAWREAWVDAWPCDGGDRFVALVERAS